MRLSPLLLGIGHLLCLVLSLGCLSGCSLLNPDATSLSASDFAVAPYVLDRHDDLVRGELDAESLSPVQVEQMLKSTAELRLLLLDAAHAEGLEGGALVEGLQDGLEIGDDGPDASLGGAE